MKGIKVFHYALSYDDCSIRVYWSSTTNFHKCLVLFLIFILHFLIMLALCLKLSMIYYVYNYAGIIGGSLYKVNICIAYCMVTYFQENKISRIISVKSLKVCILKSKYNVYIYNTHVSICGHVQFPINMHWVKRSNVVF